MDVKNDMNELGNMGKLGGKGRCGREMVGHRKVLRGAEMCVR